MNLSFRVLLFSFFMFTLGNMFGQSPMLTAMKSALVPGWGELSLGNNSGYVFLASEMAFWGARLYFNNESELKIRQSRQFAYNNANMKSLNVDAEIWHLMSRFNSSGFESGGYNESIIIKAMAEYPNPDQLEERTAFILENILDENIGWDWGTRENRREYQHLIRDSGHFEDYALATGGVIILNHVLSFLNTLRIANNKSASNLQVYTDVDGDMTRWVNVNFRF
jgi:hypothetical protein